MIEPRPFQVAGINSAIRALTNTTGSRRFLVADEVGLGKTVVARGVVDFMSANSRRRRPFRVFYVCSNAALARQNLARLIDFLPESEQKCATAEADRPSLLAVSRRPTHDRVQVFALSPATADPGRVSQGLGLAKERALAAALLHQILPGIAPKWTKTLYGQASETTFKRHFEDALLHLSGKRDASLQEMSAFREEFRTSLHKIAGRALREQLGVGKEDNLRTALHQIHDSKSDRGRTGPSLFITILRQALALAALRLIGPDLVIMDEFQRFSDMARDRTSDEDADAATDLIAAIRGNGGRSGPALLLLSATPYRPFRSRSEGDAGQADDLSDLVAFLAGGGAPGRHARNTAREGFAGLSTEYLRGTPMSERARDARSSLEALLRPLMCRRERLAGAPKQADSPRVGLLAEDAALFRSFSEGLAERHRSWAVPLWSSVPLPMQTLGNGYQSWRSRSDDALRTGTRFSSSDQANYKTLSPLPHPRLRALLQLLSPRRLALPWLPPTRPWWPLRGAWQGQHVDHGKLLVFSRYRAVPSSIAALVSYSVEAASFGSRQGRTGRRDAYLAAADQTRLSVEADQPALLGLFHPSPFLAELTVFRTKQASLAAADLERQLKGRLNSAGVSIDPVGKLRPAWMLVAGLEKKLGYVDRTDRAWGAFAADNKSAGLETLLASWREIRPIEVISREELRVLASFALSAPGIVAARALLRHWPSALDDDGLRILVNLCWSGLRTYLDRPWFDSVLSSGREHYRERLLRAVVDGNLEAVLDEHFWLLAKTGSGDWFGKLKSLRDALTLRTTNVLLHQDGPEFRQRCHVAVAMTDAGAAEPADEAFRPEDVRVAFNTPFWPYVLATTSIGQEGLDFHLWCRTLAHWDLPPGPVELEQREGRLARFASLAVRGAIAKKLAASSISTVMWKNIAEYAENSHSDQNGLSPWWTVEGADVLGLIFDVDGSEQAQRLKQLYRERALYRLVLGMPYQADLIDILEQSHDVLAGNVEALDLTPI